MIAGILVLVYYSRALDPPGKTVDPLLAHQAAYYNIKHGITAVCLVFLGKWTAVIRHNPLFSFLLVPIFPSVKSISI